MGDQNAIMGDFNEYVTSPKIKTLFASLGLYEAIIKQHSHKPAQPTCN